MLDSRIEWLVSRMKALVRVECLFPRTVSTNFTTHKEMFGPRVEEFVPGSKDI
jgi:hypothetical protein